MNPLYLSIGIGVVAYFLLKRRSRRLLEKEMEMDAPELPVPTPTGNNLLAQYRDLPIQSMTAAEPAPIPVSASPPKRKTILVEAVECAHCGKPFLPVNGNQRYCNEVCRTNFHKANS